MFVNLIRFPALTEGQEAAFVARLQPSTQVYREFPGFVPRRLLRWTDGSYAAVVENERGRSWRCTPNSFSPSGAVAGEHMRGEHATRYGQSVPRDPQGR